ncbi:protein PALS1-like [Artemia franciscana]
MNEIKSKVEEETMRIPNCKSNESILKSSITPKEDEKNDGIPVRKPSRKKNEAPSQPSNTKPIGAPTTEELATQPLTLEATIYKRPPGLDDNALGVVGGKRGRGSGTLSKIIKDSILNGDENGSRGASLRSSGTSSIHSSELDDSGSHREMAVDVPDNFISRTKTPPKWPTMKPTVNGYKPVLPSRDHLRIEEDGRLINRAQPPSVPSKTNQLPQAQTIEMTEQPSKQQLERIKKYQEDTKKKKELEEKLAREEEFLRSSLRGSIKLQALESNPPKSLHGSSGFINTAFDNEEEAKIRSQQPSPVDGQLKKKFAPNIKDLTTALAHVQQHMKRNGYSLDADLETVQNLLTSPSFRNALSLHSVIQQSFCINRPPSPIVDSAIDLVSECITSLQDSSQTEAIELMDILSRFEVEGLIYAHDKIAERVTLPPPSENDFSVDVGSSSTPSLKDHLTITPQPSHSPILLDDGIKIVRIEKTNEPLGATVRNDGESVVIGRIVRGGAAERCGQLYENDEVLEVNGVPLRGKSVNDVCDLLARMTGTLTFVIQPASDTKPSSPTFHGVMHVKAHFDYDPDEDLYIPCRELGLAFQKGDVLHVISQEDGNWWQAHRDGEEEHNLAGLIPSKSFQQQREIMKQTIMADSLESKRSKKNTLLCARKMHKKKKKKVQYNSNFTDDLDSEEILTYEEVALYYPREYHKRPLVLIGPPNIGRQELRQRLMLDSERFAAAVPHTSRPKKDNELDGQDYHFISRAQFEADIIQRRFVEHGEYERAYYGTSIDAIRAVINQGRICVLNLHPQSLKLLRTSDLMPYVVFIAPPSLEKLRQKRIAKREPVKDEELKDIIEKAREMEETFGHYFDLVIVNSDDDRTYGQLLQEVNSLEREPQWVPANWLKGDRPS